MFDSFYMHFGTNFIQIYIKSSNIIRISYKFNNYFILQSLHNIVSQITI